jgi:hypothetical protein
MSPRREQRELPDSEAGSESDDDDEAWTTSHIPQNNDSTSRNTTLAGSSNAAAATTTGITLHALVNKQAALGFFELHYLQRHRMLRKGMGMSILCKRVSDVLNVRTVEMTPGSLEKLCDTLIAVVYIEFEYPQDSEYWELVVRKARQWVKNALPPDEDLVEWLWEVANHVCCTSDQL